MTIFFTSDTHFGHYNMVHTFTMPDKVTPIRRFDSVEAMDEAMIAKWNGIVKPTDHIYHLGDVTMKAADLDRVMPRLNGKKRLIRGNHDIFPTKRYLRHFPEIMGCRIFDRMIFTHIPIAPWSFGRAYRANVHGHVHMSEPLIYRVVNPRGPEGFVQSVVYVNLCVERTNYTPIPLERIQQMVRGIDVH